MDAAKPSPDDLMKKHGLDTKENLDFIRAYEAEILGTIEAALARVPRR